MPIIVRVGPAAFQIFWALIVLLGVFVVQYGFLYALSGLTDFGKMALVNSAAISRISGGIVVFILGLVVVALGYLGVRGKIVITTSN
jgi:hypothetical protein